MFGWLTTLLKLLFIRYRLGFIIGAFLAVYVANLARFLERHLNKKTSRSDIFKSAGLMFCWGAKDYDLA
jgi:hypothetical protein